MIKPYDNRPLFSSPSNVPYADRGRLGASGGANFFVGGNAGPDAPSYTNVKRIKNCFSISAVANSATSSPPGGQILLMVRTAIGARRRAGRGGGRPDAHRARRHSGTVVSGLLDCLRVSWLHSRSRRSGTSTSLGAWQRCVRVLQGLLRGRCPDALSCSSMKSILSCAVLDR